MKNIVFAFLALFTSSLVFAKDFSEFEKSLFDNSPLPASQDSAGLSAGSSSSFSDFEKSLTEVPSEMNAVYVLRENMLEALQKKDSKNVVELVGRLKGLESRKIASYLPFELETVYIEMNMLDQLTDHYVDHYRTILDTGKYDADVRTIKDDPLYLHVVKYWKSQDTTKTPYELIGAKINNSKLTDVKRRKLEILSKLRFAYMDEKVGQDVRSLTEAFLEKYPDDPDAPWLKHTILGPLSRMDVLDFKLQKRGELKEGVIRNKLYSGGFGFNLYLAMGGFGIGFDDLYRSDIYSPEPTPVNWEFYLQLGKISASFEMVNMGVSGMTSVGFSIGYVAYDSRYIKVRPYVGIGVPYFNYTYTDAYLPGGGSYYPSEESESTEARGNRFTLGVNVDFKFITSYLFFSSSKLSSFSVVGKFGVSSSEIEADFVNGSGYEGFFCLGLGIYLW